MLHVIGQKKCGKGGGKELSKEAKEIPKDPETQYETWFAGAENVLTLHSRTINRINC